MRIDDATSRAEPCSDVPFRVTVSRRRSHRVVRISGELDVTTRLVVRDACVFGRAKVVDVDMGATIFMDCSGYSGLVAARRILQDKGGSLTLRQQTGQPAELLTILAMLERRREL